MLILVMHFTKNFSLSNIHNSKKAGVVGARVSRVYTENASSFVLYLFKY